MKLYEKMRQQKLLSTTLLLVTLSVGIVIGTLLNSGVHAARGQSVAPDATPLVVPHSMEAGNEFTKLAKKLEPSVVNITAEFTPKPEPTAGRRRGKQADPDEDDDDNNSDLFRRFFGGQGGQGGQGGGGAVPEQAFRHEQSGTGFIVDKNGYVITNKHVVSEENGGLVDHIRVKLNNDSTEYRARVIGVDAETDLAVIKIEPRAPLTPVNIANSDSVQVGDWAVAIGSPFGLEETVTAGIVSATGRGSIGSQFQRFIQTDAAINPGNSGGPLLNIRGEVIGINTMIATQNGGSQGVGFALPMNMAVRVYNDIIRDGHVTRGSIGVTWDPRSSTPEIMKALGVGHGVIIGDIQKGGPADKAGVHADDIILGLNGQDIKDGDELVARVADISVGSPVTLNIDRDGKKMDFKLVIQNRAELYKDRLPGNQIIPEEPAKPEAGPTTGQVRFGISGRPVDEEERGLTPDKHGVAITYIEPGSFAEEIGMMDHDIIIAINRQPVSSVDDIRKVQQTLKAGDPVAFRVVRKQQIGRAGRGRGTSASTTMFLSGTLPQN
jgi:serine protease Do